MGQLTYGWVPWNRWEPGANGAVHGNAVHFNAIFQYPPPMSEEGPIWIHGILAVGKAHQRPRLKKKTIKQIASLRSRRSLKK